GLKSAEDGLNAIRDVRNFGVAGGGHSAADIVGSCEKDDDFRIDSIEFAIFEPPKNVFGFVGAPAKIGRVPAKETLLPVGKQRRIIGRSPAAGDGIAFKINVDAAFLCFVQQLLVGDERIGIGARSGLIGRKR